MIPNEQYVIFMEEMIATTGWRTFVEELEKEIYNIQADALESPTWEAVCRAKGRAEGLAEITSLPAMVEDMRRRLLEGDDDASVSF